MKSQRNTSPASSISAFILAGEASGDRLAARLMDAGAQVFEDISWFGVGGPKMDACGLEKLADMEVLSIIGFGDALRHLRALTRLADELIDAILARQPEYIFTIDSKGFSLRFAKRLRRDEVTAELPIIMLTARGEEADKLQSFASGIDDYITKPFSPRELLARVKALLRRSGAPADNVLEACGIRLNLDSHRITINGEEVHTGPTEYRLLELLMRNPDRAFNRNQLLDRVWGRSVYVEERTVDVHILRLRKLLKPHGLDRTVQTVRSIGYRFSPSN